MLSHVQDVTACFHATDTDCICLQQGRLLKVMHSVITMQALSQHLLPPQARQYHLNQQQLQFQRQQVLSAFTLRIASLVS